MRMVSGALGAGLVLCSLAMLGEPAQAQEGRRARVPIYSEPTPTPWDYYIIPRYRYRAEDDRVDPCGGPVVPVIRYGSQEIYIAPWAARELGLGRIRGRDYPCGGRSRVSAY